jgi:hypothetical protein
MAGVITRNHVIRQGSVRSRLVFAPSKAQSLPLTRDGMRADGSPPNSRRQPRFGLSSVIAKTHFRAPCAP